MEIKIAYGLVVIMLEVATVCLLVKIWNEKIVLQSYAATLPVTMVVYGMGGALSMIAVYIICFGISQVFGLDVRYGIQLLP